MVSGKRAVYIGESPSRAFGRNRSYRDGAPALSIRNRIATLTKLDRALARIRRGLRIAPRWLGGLALELATSLGL